jgi:hypothetical protein
MNKIVAWLLGQQPEARHDPRLVDLEQLGAEVEEQRSEARRLRAHTEKHGPERRRRVAQNHFGESIKEALHQRGWTQT